MFVLEYCVFYSLIVFDKFSESFSNGKSAWVRGEFVAVIFVSLPFCDVMRGERIASSAVSIERFVLYFFLVHCLFFFSLYIMFFVSKGEGARIYILFFVFFVVFFSLKNFFFTSVL